MKETALESAVRAFHDYLNTMVLGRVLPKLLFNQFLRVLFNLRIDKSYHTTICNRNLKTVFFNSRFNTNLSIKNKLQIILEEV